MLGDPTVRIALVLIGPGVLAVFGLAFVCAWLLERKRHYLLLLAGACLFFTTGVTSQVLGWPPQAGANALVSGGIYTAAVLLACQGILDRSNKTLGATFHIAAFLTVVSLLWYFYYVDRNLLIRIYVQNFAYGLILLVTALRLTSLIHGRHVDRILFWVLLLFAIQFFPRTILTIGFTAPLGNKPFGSTLFWQVLQLSLAVLGASLALAVLAAAVTDLIEDLRRERDTDSLTGVLNRRGFEDRAIVLLGRLASAPVSLLICDLDHFKRINDTYGHPMGDNVLQAFGQILLQTAPQNAVIGRIGGEEFVLLLPNTDLQNAHRIAEQLRKLIEGSTFSWFSGVLTASFGVAERQSDDDYVKLFQRADGRLYQAKAAGRNRTIASDLALLIHG